MNDADDTVKLRERLEASRRRLDLLTSKPARAEAMREIANLQWQLGEITDEELHRIEEFADRFSYE